MLLMSLLFPSFFLVKIRQLEVVATEELSAIFTKWAISSPCPNAPGP